jgi:hypothetical protein
MYLVHPVDEHGITQDTDAMLHPSDPLRRLTIVANDDVLACVFMEPNDVGLQSTDVLVYRTDSMILLRIISFIK